MQDLERDLAPMPDVLGKVYRRHAALTQFPIHPVSVSKRGDKTIGGRAHGATSSTARFMRSTQFGITRRYRTGTSGAPCRQTTRPSAVGMDDGPAVPTMPGASIQCRRSTIGIAELGSSLTRSNPIDGS